MNAETKLGIFVLFGIALLGSAVFMLGDYSFQNYYPLYVEFNDVSGLPDKAVVKLSGVEVGKIKKIYIKEDKVYVKIDVLEHVRIYTDAKFLVGSTSLIGSKFLQIDQGTKSSGAFASGSSVAGSDSLPVDRALTKAIQNLENLVDELRGEGKFISDLKETVSNLREITANINELLATSKPHAERFMERLDDMSAKLNGTIGRINEIAEKMSSGKGAIGALVSDEKVKEDVTGAIANLKDAASSVKNVLTRLDGFRIHWDFQPKYEPLAKMVKTDAGLRISPRKGRYYYIGAANVASTKDISRGVNYENLNTIDAHLGWEFDNLDVYAGAIDGTGGMGVKYKPFYSSTLWNRLAFMAEISEFRRNRRIEGRYFNTPKYDAGMSFALNKYVSAGLKLNDISESKRVNYTARLIFEDKDIAYLFGLITVGSSATKGKSE